jgi:CubicO group peptidase (beta-lactamase class C family)
MRQNEGFPDALPLFFYFLGGVRLKIFLKLAAALFIGLCFYLFWSTSHTDLEEYIDEKAAEVNLNGTILVAQGDEILFQKAYGFANKEENIKNTIDTVFPIGSLTKSFTAISILQLEEEGKLSVEQPISKYVQGFPNGDDITIHHLLTHSSGIPELLNVVDNKNEHLPNEIIEQIKNKELEFKPGEKYAYSNSNYLLLGTIIESVSGQNYQDYVKKNIFEKANMKSSGFLNSSADYAVGYENMEKPTRSIHDSLTFAAGDVTSTVSDMESYNQAINNHVLLSEEATSKMQTGYMKSAPFGVAKYGYGWHFIDNKISFDHKMIQHAGGLAGHKAEFARFIEDDLTIIILTNNQGKTKLGTISREIASIVFRKRFFNWQKFI